MKKILLSLFALAGLVACNENSLTPGGGEQSGKIRFVAGGPALTANVSTKATVVTGTDLDTYGFLANAVKGTAGTDTEVWTNQEFTKVGDTWEQDKWWPNADDSYRFFAVFPKTYTTTFAAGGPTISASNAHDIICAYAANPTYKSVNTLSFDHIFARLTDVTVSAVSPYTISDVSISITPLVSGTYNLYTGAGQTDGTGWSNTSAAASASVIASATGTNSNDIYLVPGSYTLTASWTATKDNYTQTFTDKTVDVDLVAGKTNKITASLTGDGTEIKFSVSVTAWEDNIIDAGTFPLVEPTPSFTVDAQGKKVIFAPGNLQAHIASGPVNDVYTADEWRFATNQWDVIGADISVGAWYEYFCWVGSGATYNSYGLCTYYDERSAAHYGNIVNTEVLKTDWGSIPGVVSACGTGWFTLSHLEWNYLLNSRSTGVSVNSVDDARFTHARIRTDVGNGVRGVILFPDGYSGGTPDGVVWGPINNENPAPVVFWGTTCTSAGWETLQAAGCVFLPAAGGRFNNGQENPVQEVNSELHYWSSSLYPENEYYAPSFLYSRGYNLSLGFGGRDSGISVRLVKEVE